MSTDLIQGSPWFPSGDAILTSKGVGFRVHKDFIESHSAVFAKFFLESMPTHYIDGCKIYEVPDNADELESLFAVMIGGQRYYCHNFLDFIFAARVLYMCNKYEIRTFGSAALEHIAGLFPFTLQKYDFCNQEYVTANVRRDKDIWPYVHPSFLIDLSRHVELQFLLPCAYLRMVLKPVEKRFRDISNKSPVADLNSEELIKLSIFETRLTEETLKFVRSCGEDLKPTSNCETRDDQDCIKAFRFLKGHLRDKVIDEGRLRNPLGFMKLSVVTLHNINRPSACNACKVKYLNDVNQARQKIWDSLPSFLGLANWDSIIPPNFRNP